MTGAAPRPVLSLRPPSISNISEDHPANIDLSDPRSAYVEGKRIGELLSSCYGQRHGFEVMSSRCFAFVGPFSPLDRHFAIGNFIGNRLRGEPIVVSGDGSPFRSYMYAADLALWLWTILARGTSMHAYNVGSSEQISIGELAQLIAQIEEPVLPVTIKQPKTAGALPSRYVPSISRGETELSLASGFDIKQSISQTIAWHRAAPNRYGDACRGFEFRRN